MICCGGQDKNLIYTLFQSGIWRVDGDTWREGDAQSDPAIQAPDGFYQPVRGFGNVWRNIEGIRDTLGWGLQDELGLAVQVQLFEQGFVLGPLVIDENEPSSILILFNDLTFRVIQLGAE